MSAGQPTGQPSPKALLRSTVIALVVAIVILVTMVLPAEYGIDPTGIGRVLKLTQMGEFKIMTAQEAAMDAQDDSIAAAVADSIRRANPPVKKP